MAATAVVRSGVGMLGSVTRGVRVKGSKSGSSSSGRGRVGRF